MGIQTSEGVVLAAEKRITSPLLLPSSVHKVMEIDSHLGCAMSGLTADARILVNHARVEAQHYRFTYDEPLPVESCTQGICDLALRFGEDLEDDEDAMSRPFGVALLVAGVDAQGPQLFHTDPSGTFLRYAAKAIGAGSEGAQTQLENEYHRSLTLHEAEVLALQVLKQVMEEKLEAYNVEVGVISTADRKFRILSNAEVVALIGETKPTDEEQSKA